jgi:hypothetical protein
MTSKKEEIILTIPLDATGTSELHAALSMEPVVIPSSDWVPKCTWIRIGGEIVDPHANPEELASIMCVNNSLALKSKMNCKEGTCRLVHAGGFLTTTTPTGEFVAREFCLVDGDETFRGKIHVPSATMSDEDFRAKAPKPSTKPAGRECAVLLADMFEMELLCADVDTLHSRLAAITAALKALPPGDVYQILRPTRVVVGVACKHLAALAKLLTPPPARTRESQMAEPSRGSSTECRTLFEEDVETPAKMRDIPDPGMATKDNVGRRRTSAGYTRASELLATLGIWGSSENYRLLRPILVPNNKLLRTMLATPPPGEGGASPIGSDLLIYSTAVDVWPSYTIIYDPTVYAVLERIFRGDAALLKKLRSSYRDLMRGQ